MQNLEPGERFIGATVGCLHLACEVTYTIFLLKYSSDAYVIGSLIVCIFIPYRRLDQLVVVEQFVRYGLYLGLIIYI